MRKKLKAIWAIIKSDRFCLVSANLNRLPKDKDEDRRIDLQLFGLLKKELKKQEAVFKK